MTENDPENEPILGEGDAARSDSAETLHEKLRSMGSEQAGGAKNPRKRAAQDIFSVQEKIAERKNAAKKLGIAALIILAAVCIGYPTKLAYVRKKAVEKLTADYKSLQIVLADMTQRDYQLYKKIFPQVEELESSRLDSALKAINDNIDLAAKMNQDADDLWAREEYEQALALYEQAAKVNPLNDRSVYLEREAELTKYDQEHFQRVYVVKKGDTLARIAQKAGVSVERIQNANGPKYAVLYEGRLVRGMRLALPASPQNRPGESDEK